MGVTYRPLLELRPPRVKPMTLTGSATIGRYWKKLSFDVSLRGVSKMSPILKGNTYFLSPLFFHMADQFEHTKGRLFGFLCFCF